MKTVQEYMNDPEMAEAFLAPMGKTLSYLKAPSGIALHSQTSCLLIPGRGLVLSAPSMAPFPPLGRRTKPFDSAEFERHYY
jgi:hypothetical protein